MKTLSINVIAALFAIVMINPAQAFIGPTGQSNSTNQAGNFITSEVADIWIINVTGSTASKGSIMAVSTVEDDGYRATEASLEGGPALCVLTAACTDGAKCLCRQHGYVSQVNWVDSGVAGEDATAGACIYVSGDDNGAAQGISGDNAIVSGVSNPVCLGVFLDSDTADDAAIEAYINIR